MQPTVHTIDAAGKKLGRVASLAVHVLMEKNTPSFEKHKKNGAKVHITNAAHISFSEKRVSEVRYKRASGYPGNYKEETIADVRKKHGVEEVIRRAVKGMLPSNKLRPDMLKRLTVSE